MNHSVYSLADVTVSTGKGKSMSVIGVDIPNRNTLVLKLDTSILLYAGLYAIRFNIKVPVKRPQLDIWRVAVCQDPPAGTNVSSCTLQGTARSGRGADIKAVWALPGFDARQPPGSTLLLPMAA